jgi:uncharacterized protein YdaU (DUF1376 family)
MTLAFVAFHMRDYQKDTQQLPLEGHGAYFLLLQHCWTHGRIPLDDVARAAICKVPLARWRKQLAPLVAGYFDANGENKRATVEIARAEKLRLRQAMAGHKGGVEVAKRKAELRATAKPRPSHGPPTAEPRSSRGEAMVEPSREDIINTSFGAARARDPTPEEIPEKSTPEPADGPAGFAEKAREAVQKSSGIGSGLLVATMQAKGWVR